MSKTKSCNILWHHGKVTRQAREDLLGQKGLVIWFTGLSGAGKSTISSELERALFESEHVAYSLDGDNIRHGLNKDLGFSSDDRVENIRRVGEVAKLFCDANIITIAAFISPYRSNRDMVRALLENGQFIEIYVKCPVSVCETRDAKGLYKKARAGEIQEFTGISAPYEEPLNPEIILDTSVFSVDDSVRTILSFLREKGYIRN